MIVMFMYQCALQLMNSEGLIPQGSIKLVAYCLFRVYSSRTLICMMEVGLTERGSEGWLLQTNGRWGRGLGVVTCFDGEDSGRFSSLKRHSDM